MEEKSDRLENLYIYLAAYKRKLGIQMEEVEVKMGRIEKILGVSHFESMELRIKGMDLIRLEGGF